jgi:hypothetical protein
MAFRSPTLFRRYEGEKLAELDGIRLGRETIRQWMMVARLGCGLCISRGIVGIALAS